MAVWIVLGLALISILFLGFTRVKLPRQAGFEGIESPEVVQAYDRISRWPQFKVLRRIVVGELKKYHPKGMLVDVGCGPGYLVAVIARALPDLRITGSDISEEMTAKATRNLAALGCSGRAMSRSCPSRIAQSTSSSARCLSTTGPARPGRSGKFTGCSSRAVSFSSSTCGGTAAGSSTGWSGSRKRSSSRRQ